MEAMIITIAVVVVGVLAERFGADTHAEDTTAWWPGPSARARSNAAP
jgi:hypothetical protein